MIIINMNINYAKEENNNSNKDDFNIAYFNKNVVNKNNSVNKKK